MSPQVKIVRRRAPSPSRPEGLCFIPKWALVPIVQFSCSVDAKTQTVPMVLAKPQRPPRGLLSTRF